MHTPNGHRTGVCVCIQKPMCYVPDRSGCSMHSPSLLYVCLSACPIVRLPGCLPLYMTLSFVNVRFVCMAPWMHACVCCLIFSVYVWMHLRVYVYVCVALCIPSARFLILSLRALMHDCPLYVCLPVSSIVCVCVCMPVCMYVSLYLCVCSISPLCRPLYLPLIPHTTTTTHPHTIELTGRHT